MDVAVLGDGRTAQALGARCVRDGHRVRLRGEDANAVMDAVDGVERDAGPDAAVDVDGTTDMEAAVGDADIVIDTVGGDVEETRVRLAEVEELVAEETIIAAGNPTVSVTSVAAGLRRPGWSIGLSFVEPDGPLVEVVIADQTTADARDRTVSFVDGLEYASIVVADAPGFVTSRLDLALIAEAIRTVENGVASVPDVDRAMADGRGHPNGPLVTADQLGLDSVLATLEDLTERLDDRFVPPELLRRKVAEGDLGKGSGEGFYVWESREPAEPAAPNPTVQTRDDQPGPPDP